MMGTISRAILYTLYALSIAGLLAGIVAAKVAEGEKCSDAIVAA